MSDGPLPLLPGDMDEGHILACAKYPVAKLYNENYKGLPDKFIEALEQNQLLRSCCRHPENHAIAAFYSCEAEREKGIPDVYINYCTCGRKHRRLMMGSGARPFWDVK